MSGYGVKFKIPIYDFIKPPEKVLEECSLDIEPIEGSIFSTLSDIEIARQVSLLILPRPKFIEYWKHVPFYMDWREYDASAARNDLSHTGGSSFYERITYYSSKDSVTKLPYTEYKNRIVREGGWITNKWGGKNVNSIAISDVLMTRYMFPRIEYYISGLRKELEVVQRHWLLEEPELNNINIYHTSPSICCIVADPCHYFQYQMQVYEEMFKGWNVTFLVFFDNDYYKTWEMMTEEFSWGGGQRRQASLNYGEPLIEVDLDEDVVDNWEETSGKRRTQEDREQILRNLGKKRTKNWEIKEKKKRKRGRPRKDE